MRISKQIQSMHESGDVGQYLNGYAEKIKQMEDLVECVAHIGVDFGYGVYSLPQEKIDEARKIIDGWSV